MALWWCAWLQGKIDSISDYDPLDLFSSDAGRMLKAIRALFANPQNNIRLFLDGRPVKRSSSASEGDSLPAGAAKALGLADELGNYAEYSGAPNAQASHQNTASYPAAQGIGQLKLKRFQCPTGASSSFAESR